MSRPNFATRPWDAVPDTDLAPAAQVPTMLSPAEQRLYFWLAREALAGEGPIADLGSFVGGSSARLAAGLASRGRAGRVHLFDRFTATGAAQAMLRRGGIKDAIVDDDILPVSKRLLSRLGDRFVWHAGEIETLGWPEGAGDIPLMTLDICKTPESCDHVAGAFLPHLRHGGIVVQQDFGVWSQPWTCVQTLLLLDWLEPLALVGDSLVMRVARVPDAAAMHGVAIADFDDNALLAGLAEAHRAFAAFDVAPAIAAMEAAVRANPGIRRPWRMTTPPPC